MDLAEMSLTDLRKLQNKINQEIQRRADTERKALLKQFKKMAADRGMSFEELVGNGDPATVPAITARRGRKPGGRKTAASGPKGVIRFRHPENSGWVWSGRGRRPQWFIDWTEAGKPLAELEVNHEA